MRAGRPAVNASSDPVAPGDLGPHTTDRTALLATPGGESDLALTVQSDGQPVAEIGIRDAAGGKAREAFGLPSIWGDHGRLAVIDAEARTLVTLTRTRV